MYVYIHAFSGFYRAQLNKENVPKSIVIATTILKQDSPLLENVNWHGVDGPSNLITQLSKKKKNQISKDKKMFHSVGNSHLIRAWSALYYFNPICFYVKSIWLIQIMGYDLNLLMIEIHIFNQLVGKSYMYIICILPDSTTMPRAILCYVGLYILYFPFLDFNYHLYFFFNYSSIMKRN